MSEAKFITPQSYNQEEIQQILHLAIAKKTDKEQLSREQLWEIAAELEIAPEVLAVAEQEWLKKKELTERKREFDRFRREKLQQKTIRYLIINSFIMGLDWLGGNPHSLSWSLYILLLWGLGLSLEAWKTFQQQGEAYEQAFEHWRFKKEMKESITSLWEKIKSYWLSTN